MKNFITYKFFPAAVIFFIFGISTSNASVNPLAIEYKNGMVSCRSNKISVVGFLKELAGVSHIEIYILGRIQDSTLPVDFQQVPITQVISSLLRGYSFALVYNEKSNDTGRIYFFDNIQSGDVADIQLPVDDPDDFNQPAPPAINDETMDPEEKRLVLKIAKLEAEIANGNAQREYNFWIQKKDPVYVYNPWDDLEKSKEKLEALQYGQ